MKKNQEDKLTPPARMLLKDIIKYIEEERFSEKHIDAILFIVLCFNHSEDLEKEIFDFSSNLCELIGEGCQEEYII